MRSPDRIIDALINLGDGDTPSEEVVAGCQEFLCMLTSTKEVSAIDAATLRWRKFKTLKDNQGKH